MLHKNVDCASLTFEATLPDRRSYGVLVAKRTYQIGRQGLPEPRPEQELLVFGDHAYGEVNETSLLYPTDVVPYKPRTDVLLAANSHAPSAQPQQSWACGIRVQGRRSFTRTLNVHGPRQWVPRWRIKTPNGFSPRRPDFAGWHLSDPEPTRQVPIRWEHAWGGANTDPSDPTQIAVREENPIGCGWIDPHLTDHTKPVPAPQLEWPVAPLGDPYQICTPACFAPVMPAWLPRRPLGGTFDQAWMETGQPWWPADYDFRYHNAAPDALQSEAFFDGNEALQLFNLIDGMPECEIALPASAIVADLGGMNMRMNLDTVLLDVREPYPEDWLIALTWRLVLPPVMDYEITLSACDLGSSLYQTARPATTPNAVAMAQRQERESQHV